jgi:hypothetical protein
VVENFEEVQRFLPRTYPRVLEENQNSHTSTLAYISLILGGVATALVVACAALTFKQKSRRVMIYAQVEFMLLLLAGVFLVSIASMLQAIRPTDFRCVTLIWLINLGYTLELVPLIVKIGAINRLMQAARRMRRVMLKRKQLFGAVAVLVAIVCIFLMLWTLLDPPQKKAYYLLTERMSEYGETIVQQDHFCQSERFRNGWQFISLGSQCFFLLAASVLAFQTRNLSKGINEAQTLATLIYSHFVFVGCRFLIFILESSLGGVVATQIFSLLYSLDSCATLVIYFVPKFMAGENDDFVQSYYGQQGVSVTTFPTQSRQHIAFAGSSTMRRLSDEQDSTALAEVRRGSASNIEEPENKTRQAVLEESGNLGHSKASSASLPDNDVISQCNPNKDVSTEIIATESGDGEPKC